MWKVVLLFIACMLEYGHTGTKEPSPKETLNEKFNKHQAKNILFPYFNFKVGNTDETHNPPKNESEHYCDVIMGTVASQITSLTIVHSTIDSGADQRKHQSSGPLAFVRGIHRWPVNSPHKWLVTRKMCPFDDFIMRLRFKETRNLVNGAHPVVHWDISKHLRVLKVKTS